MSDKKWPARLLKWVHRVGLALVCLLLVAAIYRFGVLVLVEHKLADWWSQRSSASSNTSTPRNDELLLHFNPVDHKFMKRLSKKFHYTYGFIPPFLC
jgi:hypothetical protein